jgi:heterodisulfide reductase subunit A
VYIPTPQAVPNIPTIDAEYCMHFKTGECGACVDVCQADAIDFEQKEEIIEEEVGCVVVSTGYELYPVEEIGEYGYGTYPDVIDGLTFERLLSASGPTGGEVRRPSDGKEPKSVVFISCVGSRDPENHFSYCSKICCMYSAKHAMLYKHKVHDGQAYLFYMDIRAGGKAYEEFIQRATEEDKVLYLRGRVSKIFQEDDKLMVWGVDTLTNEKVEIEADLVVLAMAIVPSPGTRELAAKLRIAVGADGFLSEAHPKLRPVESLTAGYYLAGCGQAPKDIPETVAQASGAASKVAALFSSDKLLHDPTVAHVDPDVCTGCGNCVAFCAYEAPQLDEKRRIAVINEVLCEGCGGCSMACPSGAMQHLNFRKRQTLDMVDALLE